MLTAVGSARDSLTILARRRSHYSGVIPVVFKHSGVQDFDHRSQTLPANSGHRHAVPVGLSLYGSEFSPPICKRLLMGTDEPDETSFRALRPKTFRLTLDVTETVSCYSPECANDSSTHCGIPLFRQRRGRGSSGLGVVSRTDVSPGRGCDFGIHTELPLVAGPTPTRTPHLRPRPRRR